MNRFRLAKREAAGKKPVARARSTGRKKGLTRAQVLAQQKAGGAASKGETPAAAEPAAEATATTEPPAGEPAAIDSGTPAETPPAEPPPAAAAEAAKKKELPKFPPEGVEIPANARLALGGVDTNRDGRVSLEEFNALPEGDGAGYSSVIAADVHGQRQYIQFLGRGVVGVAADDGRYLWRYDKPANGTANISTPVYHDGAVFAASAYGKGGGLARLTRDGDRVQAEEVYFNKKMQNHHGGMVLVGDHVYGTNGSSLLCVNFKTGKIAWQDRCVGKGSVAYADGHLYVRSESGPAALVEATPEGYKEKGRFNQPERSSQRAWPHPVIAGGKLYLRDWDRLFCYDIKGQ